MIDRDGYRPNVAIVLCNAKNEVFWGKRIKEHSWQFPQGGIKSGESPEDAMFRELEEETGLLREHVRILGRTKNWLHYSVPNHWVKREWRGTYKGQKQIWYLLKLTGRDCDIKLRASSHPEFDAWRWHDYWVPLDTRDRIQARCVQAGAAAAGALSGAAATCGFTRPTALMVQAWACVPPRHREIRVIEAIRHAVVDLPAAGNGGGDGCRVGYAVKFQQVRLDTVIAAPDCRGESVRARRHSRARFRFRLSRLARDPRASAEE